MQGQNSQIYNCGHSGRTVNGVITTCTLYLQIVKAYMQPFIQNNNKIVCEKKSTRVVYMSVPTSTPPVFQPYYPTDNFLENQIYATVAGNAERTKQQAANDIARDILRAVDHNGQFNSSATDRNGATNAHITELSAAQLATAIERNGANGMSTTERVNSQLASAIERNGAVNSHLTELTAAQIATAVERNGANGMSTTERVNSQLAMAIERNGATNQSAIERTTGEARLTTVVSDAASRQAANDNARDVERAVDRNGLANLATTKDAYNGLLGSVERNAGETRLSTAIGQGQTDLKLTDVRHSILNDVNRGTNEVLTAGTQSLNVLNKAITDSAWEQRTASATGFAGLGEEHLRTKFDLSKQNSDHYASMMLEQQKLGQYITSKADNHFAINQLEMQKVREGLATQAAQNFAISQLETQKVKEGLACQAANNFAISQLEAQKNREAIQMQLAEAKYEALKSQQYLGDKMAECCCTIKEKMDTIDRDRLRDNLTVARDRNNTLEQVEVMELLLNRRGGYGGEGRGDRDRR